MPQKHLEQTHREGISLVAAMQLPPDDVAIEAWYMQWRWPTEVAWPRGGTISVQPGTAAYANKAGPYQKMPGDQKFVNYFVDEYVQDMVNINGTDIGWSAFKRSYWGALHHFRKKYFGCSVSEFADHCGTYNISIMDMLESIIQYMGDKRHRFCNLIVQG